MADERKKERRGSTLGFAGKLVKVKWLTDFNDRVRGDVAEVPEGKAAYWIERKMVEAVKAKVTKAPVRKIVEAEVKK